MNPENLEKTLHSAAFLESDLRELLIIPDRPEGASITDNAVCLLVRQMLEKTIEVRRQLEFLKG